MIPVPVSRRFPNLGWAWPTGALDRLLRAAIGPDDEEALAHFRAWLRETDLDDVTFREQRVLVAIVHRFGRRLADEPEYPRLTGVHRKMWTNARLAMATAQPVLGRMVDAGVEVTLIKGAARIALDPAAIKSRLAWDIDLLVPPEAYRAALRIAADEGWEIAEGTSPLRAQAMADRVRAYNLLYGTSGDLDIHRIAYPGHEEADESFRSRSMPARYAGIDVRVPSAADSLVMALNYGGREAFSHSDWLVDSAVLIRSGEVDWAVALESLRAVDATLQAEIALRYLVDEVGIGVPDDAMRALAAEARTLPGRIAGLLQAKPRNDWTRPVWLARGVAKQTGMPRRPGDAPSGPLVRGRVGSAESREGAAALRVRVAASPIGGKRNVRFRAVLALETPPVRRRLEFELNTGDRHVTRLTAQKIRRAGGMAQVTFAGTVELGGDDDDLWIEARPGRFLRHGAPPALRAKYDPLPFRLVSFALAGETDAPRA